MATPAPLRLVEHQLVAFRHTWRGSAIGSFLNPLLFLTAIGVGLGGRVDRAPLGGVGYVAFLAPGLLAATTAQVATGEGLWPVLGGFQWTRQWFAAAATPLGGADIALGLLVWVAIRLALTAAPFLLVVACFGALRSPWAVLALPAAVLTGLAFATPAVAWTATRTVDNSFNIILRFVVLPLFLFSGAFFPISQLPVGLRPIAWATPLWHGVELCRALTLGRMGWATLGHVAALAAFATVGAALSARHFDRRLSA